MARKRVRRTRDEMEGEAVAPVEQAPTREEVTAATVAAVRPAAVSHGNAVRPGVQWTLDSRIRDVLMEDCGGLSDMGLHDFLMEHFGETFGSPSVSMRVFMDDPRLCVTDEPVLVRITNSSPYVEFVRKYELHTTMNEAVNGLHTKGIFTLRRWESTAAANEAEDIVDSVKGKLNAALLIARDNKRPARNRNTPSPKEIDGGYDAVVNARWSYVVRSDEYGEGTLGMGVLGVAPGVQPRLWSEAQAKVIPDSWDPWEGDEVPGVKGKLVMAVLSSQKGWPYRFFDEEEIQMEKMDTLTGYNAACDAYIRKEDMRAWYFAKENINMWRMIFGDFCQFLLIGTSGIGKSSSTGSLLLYQLLRYPLEGLEVVAYFVDAGAYIFYKPKDRRRGRVVYYARQGAALREMLDMVSVDNIKGYAIINTNWCSIDVQEMPLRWGVIMISSPKLSSLQRFTYMRPDALPIYINCYEDTELKAALVWERHWQLTKGQIKKGNVNIANDWKVLKERIDMVGPLPRYVLAREAIYEKRLKDVESALRLLPDGDFEYFMRIRDNTNEWYEDDTLHKLLKLVRLRVNGTLKQGDKPISLHVLKELRRKTSVTFFTDDVRRGILSGDPRYWR
ncbi:unnamed protein product [Trypanosoma congolense IL3000]|uniref:WGS project CAEQ00000000 data, annotated contig 1273 n=1 Tax=Trypanosoma congolense (strain IL3000) TaxID=1068625 RepID=F9W540_TRYCI|nr:unnamed protein product [Trypanosoma congolense IL3000]